LVVLYDQFMMHGQRNIKFCKLLFSHSKTARYGNQMEKQLLKLTVTRSTTISWAAWPWRRMHYNLPKLPDLLVQRHSITSRHPCNLSNTSV